MFCASTSGLVFALDATTGSTIWVSRPIGSDRVLASYFSSPTVTDSGLILIATDFCGACSSRDPGRLVALNPSTGSTVYELSLPGLTQSTVAIFNNQGILPCKDGSVVAFDVQTGRVNWRLALGTFTRSSATIAGDGTIFLGDSLGVVAISQSGQLLWRYEVDGEVISSPSIGPDGTIVFGNIGDFGANSRSIFALR
jgi:outer membrane protein assembly factor BamB